MDIAYDEDVVQLLEEKEYPPECYERQEYEDINAFIGDGIGANRIIVSLSLYSTNESKLLWLLGCGPRSSRPNEACNRAWGSGKIAA